MEYRGIAIFALPECKSTGSDCTRSNEPTPGLGVSYFSIDCENIG